MALVIVSFTSAFTKGYEQTIYDNFIQEIKKKYNITVNGYTITLNDYAGYYTLRKFKLIKKTGNLKK